MVVLSPSIHENSLVGPFSRSVFELPCSSNLNLDCLSCRCSDSVCLASSCCRRHYMRAVWWARLPCGPPRDGGIVSSNKIYLRMEEDGEWSGQCMYVPLFARLVLFWMVHINRKRVRDGMERCVASLKKKHQLRWDAFATYICIPYGVISNKGGNYSRNITWITAVITWKLKRVAGESGGPK